MPTSFCRAPSADALLLKAESSNRAHVRVNVLLAYCRAAGWSGPDPYDGLNSRLFQALPFVRSKQCRLAFIQLLKRCPVNLRPLFGIPAKRNPKGTALFASSLLRLARLGLAEISEAEKLLEDLQAGQCPGHKCACWGYHFDWQTRGVLVPSATPNIVCTTFIGHAFLDAFEATGKVAYLETAASTARFIVEELAADLPEDAFCIRYFMVGESRVHNASLLGAAYLIRVFLHTHEPRLREIALRAVDYSAKRQASDGSWPYGENPSQRWIDSFHTGYNLLALWQIGHHVDIPGLPEVVERGYAFYRNHFFRDDGAVRYFHNRTYPVDAHAVGHALLTLAEFSDHDPSALDQAHRCLDWAMKHLWSHRGYFYYQKWQLFTNRIHYMRWSQAWMLTGITALLERLSSRSLASRALPSAPLLTPPQPT